MSNVKQITTDDLRHMEDQEGLILLGCFEDPQVWVDGINDLLTEAGILLNGSTFDAKNVFLFEHGSISNLLFSFEGVKLDMGRLAMWRLQTHDHFGGTWLSDFVGAKSAPSVSTYGENSVRSLAPPLPMRPASLGSHGDPNSNKLGGFVQEQRPQKPKMELLGQDGNIFGIMGRASRLLKQVGMKEQNDKMISRVTACGSYDEALSIISEYVDTELSDHTEPQKTTQKKGKDAYER